MMIWFLRISGDWLKYLINILPLSSSFLIVAVILVIGAAVSYITGKLTLAASVTGVLVAIAIYVGAGIAGVAMLTAFFVLGTVVTSYKRDEKLALGTVQASEGRRKAGQVFANAGVAGVLALLSTRFDRESILFIVMIAGSLASATGDTFSSELGNIYGRNFYNILTLKKDQRGLNGVISTEGTLFGLVGSLAIAFVFALFFGWHYSFFVIVVSGVAGNLCDSMLGAVFERKGLLNNDAVNFLNTAVAALIAFFLMRI